MCFLCGLAILDKMASIRELASVAYPEVYASGLVWFGGLEPISSRKVLDIHRSA